MDFLERLGDVFGWAAPAGMDTRRRPEDWTHPVRLRTRSLMRLRLALELMLAVWTKDHSPVRKLLDAPDASANEAWIRCRMLGPAPHAPEYLPTIARLWLFDLVWMEASFAGAGARLVPVYGEGQPRPPFDYEIRPLTAYQYALWIAAATAGAWIPPLPLPTAGICRECKEWFVRDRRRARNDAQNTFCSAECGRRFHNRASARRTRARKKLAGLEEQNG
jgi:hypothetical protein